MPNLDSVEPNPKPIQHNAYHVPKKVFWPMALMFAAIFVVLLVLTIYFGVNRKSHNVVEIRSTTTSPSTVSLPVTTTISPLPPVERIPNNWRPLSYQLTVTPNLTDETFTGKESQRLGMLIEIGHFLSYHRGSGLHLHLYQSHQSNHFAHGRLVHRQF